MAAAMSFLLGALLGAMVLMVARLARQHLNARTKPTGNERRRRALQQQLEPDYHINDYKCWGYYRPDEVQVVRRSDGRFLWFHFEKEVLDDPYGLHFCVEEIQSRFASMA